MEVVSRRYEAGASMRSGLDRQCTPTTSALLALAWLP